MCRIILTIIIFLLPIVFSHAQEATEEPDTSWEIIERCVGDPITPPDDWTFEGTILATGWAGIHGINANWDTPRVQIFYDDWTLFQELSPDDRWLATTTATEVPCPNCFSHAWNITELRILSTVDMEEYVLPINVGYEYGLGYQTRIQMRWWNSEEIVFFTDAYSNRYSIYGRVDGIERINPFTQEIIPLELSMNALTNDFDFHPAPNWEIGVYNPIQLPDEGKWALYSLQSGELIKEMPNLRGGAFLTDVLVWSDDSSKFIAITESEGKKYLTFYDYAENHMANILTLPENASPHHIEWSFDGNYVALVQSIGSFQDDVLIIDIANKSIINTCIQSATLHWSPIFNQLALLSNNGQSSILIFEPQTYLLIHTNKYHDGRIIGWRED